MRKIFCDICGKEIDPCNETWRQQLQSNGGNPTISFNESLGEMCEGMCHENSLLCVDDEIA